MITIRKAAERGHADFGWLDSRHSFSFGQYHDPRHMGFGPLRVINDDRVAAGRGFGTHPHRDMEIVTYVLEGALEHQDSLGSGSVMRPGDVQRMSAGTGIRHSELNHSATEPVHFLQIWIEPERTGLAPSYAQAHVDPADRQGRLVLVASRDGRAGSLSLNRDADIHVARLAPGEAVGHTPEAGRMLWLQVASGSVRLNGQELAEGDGAALTGEPALEIEGVEAAEILLFDMAG
ncbi:MAG: pirin family protein [Geminicoccaceae bacterium]|jgi:redox-sensitive bicupin YhaK (pirin superfamily)|nr:pirin family protein [Geminicoccaceae bacterium]